MSNIKTFKANIQFNCTDAQVAQVANALQALASLSEPDDLIKIAVKVKQNPNLIKTALKYI